MSASQHFKGLNRVPHRVMHRLFKRFWARPATSDEVRSIVHPLETRVAALESALREWADAHERLDLAFNSFRGRVYAWRKWEPRHPDTPEPPAERTEKPQELPNSDPRVSKAELRSRLLKPGKPYPHN